MSDTTKVNNWSFPFKPKEGKLDPIQHLIAMAKAGGGYYLDPGGITISGPLARLNAGGSPGKGSGIGIKPPVLPGAADSDKAGSLLEQALANELTAKAKPKRTLNFSG